MIKKKKLSLESSSSLVEHPLPFSTQNKSAKDAEMKVLYFTSLMRLKIPKNCLETKLEIYIPNYLNYLLGDHKSKEKKHSNVIC